AVVDGGVGAGVEEERQVDAGQDQDDERVERQLADHERPVVGEDLVEGRPAQLGGAETVVDPAGEAVGQQPLGPAPALPRHHRPRSQKPGPTGLEKSPVATMKPSSSTPSGSWGSARAAGPNTGLAPSSTSNVDWWHGHSSRPDSAWYRPTGQPTWVQSLE